MFLRARPTHDIQNCESCHYEGTYNAPSQTKSLPDLISASHSELEGWDGDIGEISEYTTGPAARASDECHRAEKINEDEASELVSFYQHTKRALLATLANPFFGDLRRFEGETRVLYVTTMKAYEFLSRAGGVTLFCSDSR